ncbi:hypothetical protein ABT024_05390 [Streptomyces sp. NPDC002812]|uniref:hypothetical protein n=1 Tax=Streptomyces sp. NPDC002812 TaxID=3154434 RepID=UPI003317AE7B
MPADGEWNLEYGAEGLHPAVDFTFGTIRSGFPLMEPYEITYADGDLGDAPMPRTDSVRLGQDYRGPATLTFEMGVDTVPPAGTVVAFSRHANNLDALSVMAQAWDAEGLRRRFATPAVLRTMQAGRARRFYGRPRKWAATGSRLTRQGYTPVVATFTCVDATAYDDVEQSARIVLQPAPHRGLQGPLTDPITMGGAGVGTVQAGLHIEGTKAAWPVITIRGPITRPSVQLLDQVVPGPGGTERSLPGWTVGLNLDLKDTDSVTIDTRPWARTVLRNGVASVAGALTWGSPRLENLRLPVGIQNMLLYGTSDTGTATMTVAWRNAYAYL